MEFWARWAHRALWHASLWHMHESHHRPREGPFELNDVFAISLLAYGFFHRGIVPGLCFGAGLGITLFGMAYMFVHDGLVHRRFPVGPIADVPYFRRVAASHKIHHMDKFGGVPYGLFLGPKELEEVGGLDELVSSPVSEATDTEDAGEEKTRPVVCVVRTSVFMGQSVPNEF
uniref:beta-carotene 3-hydroxylase n=1 Tax=Zea mays TaxID=4577 RepID=C4JBZ5_MAIZE|nr:unknown [Zea mays]